MLNRIRFLRHQHGRDAAESARRQLRAIHCDPIIAFVRKYHRVTAVAVGNGREVVADEIVSDDFDVFDGIAKVIAEITPGYEQSAGRMIRAGAADRNELHARDQREQEQRIFLREFHRSVRLCRDSGVA